MSEKADLNVILAGLAVTRTPKFKLAAMLDTHPARLGRWLSGRQQMPAEKYELACGILRTITSKSA